MGHPAQTDGTADSVAIGARGDAPDERAVTPDRLVVIEQRLRLVEDEDQEPADERLFALGQKRIASRERMTFVEAHREGEPGLERRVLAAEVVTPRAIRLLDAERVHGVIAGVPETEVVSGCDHGVVDAAGEFGGDVQLPAELADVGDARGAHRSRGEPDLARREIRRRRAREVGVREPR